MSIYTDMIEYIETNGIGTVSLYDRPGKPCCLFGVKNKIIDIGFDKSLYEVETIPELVSVVKQFMPTHIIDRYYLKDDADDANWVYTYNDQVIMGDKDHAIRLLQVAEKLRIKK